MITFRSSAVFDQSVTLILVDPAQIKTKKIPGLKTQLIEQILNLVQSGQFEGDKDQLFPLVVNKRLILLAGVGKKDESLTALRLTVRKALKSSFASKAKKIELIPHTQDAPALQAVIEGAMIGTYTWKKYLTQESENKKVDLERVYLVAQAASELEQTVKICEGVNFARDLVNDNADTVTSEFIETQLRNLIKGHKNISTEILNRKELTNKGLNLHLAVNQGSSREPKLIIIRYQGGGAKEGVTALVGKGITFDTGGLNIKPTGHMETMRTDMSGAAAVAGVLKNTLALGLKKNILFVFGIAENVVGSRSYKPGDVFRGYSGKTVEIGNTDAEGRLVLADAIAYVVKNYKPDRIIDIATLTGSCVVALGHDYTGLVTPDDEFSKALVRASKATDDRLWRLPSYPEIKEYMKSSIADIKNTSSIKGAGACTAAEFLRQFTGGIPWAHLDIAGTAYVDGSTRMYFGHGATGAGVRLLTEFLRKH